MLEQAVLIGLAAWRLAALLSYERGPFEVLQRARELLGFKHDETSGEPYTVPDNLVGRLVGCVWCLSVWTAPAMYGLWQLEPIAVMVIAASSVVVAMERWARP